MIDAGASALYTGRDASGRISGVVHDGPCFVFAVATPEDVDCFIASPLGGRVNRMIVAPRAGVERFWAGAKSRFPKASVVRASQPIYALTQDAFAAVAPLDELDFEIGTASIEELDELALHAARMAAGEFGVQPPTRVDFAFRSRTAQTITSGRFWRARRDGKLLFQCYAGSSSPQTVQIQGVWAPPGARGKGDATRAFTAICEQLLRRHNSLSLYVNDFNRPAIAMYERVGFVRAGEFASIIF